MADAESVSSPGGSREPVASLRHTVIVVGIVAAITLSGVFLQRRGGPGGDIVQEHGGALRIYLSLILLEWAFVRYIAVGLRRRGNHLRDLVGARWGSGRRIVLDLAIAATFWGFWAVAGEGLSRALGPSGAKSIQILLPQRNVEIVAWVALSVTAGICEEIIYRGYLQTQILAFTRSPVAAVLGQAVLFGVSHGYQGVQSVITITVYGALFGLLAWWRRSLRPGMIAHAWTDIFSGLLSGRG
jgi:membrane protease YdiL (CAAX protease family)